MNSYHDLSNHSFHVARSRENMRRRRLTVITPALLLLLTLLSATSTLFHAVSADPVAELSVEVSANVLRAGSNNTIIMRIRGVGKLVSNLDVSLNLPSSLVLFGDNHWRRTSFGPGDHFDVTLVIFAQASAAGSSYQATVNGVYKEAGETSYSQETHTIGFLVRGWIDMVVYDLSVTPSPAGPGSTVTISGSLLNRGVTSAMFTNLTIKPAKSLVLTSQSSSYMGQVDPNAPAPFGLSAQIEPTTPDGRYDVTLIVYYQDDFHTDQQTESSVSIDVSSAATQTQTTTRQTGPISLLLDYSQYVLGLIVLVVLILIARRLRRRRTPSRQQGFPPRP